MLALSTLGAFALVVITLFFMLDHIPETGKHGTISTASWAAG